MGLSWFDPSIVGVRTGRYDRRHIGENKGHDAGTLEEVLRRTTIFRRLSPEDRQRLASVASVRDFEKGAPLFSEGDALGFPLYRDRRAREGLQDHGARDRRHPGDFSARAIRWARLRCTNRVAYPASAVALEPTRCLLIPRHAFFSLLETHPTMVRGLLIGLTHRLVELTNRLTELSGGRVEARLARFLLKLTDDMGQPRPDGTFIPLALSRQEIADMIGTTIETSIRIMSRWGKQDIVRTEKDGFVVVDRAALEAVAMT